MSKAEAVEKVLDFYKANCPAEQRCAETIESVGLVIHDLEVDEEDEDEEVEDDDEEDADTE